MEEPHNDVHLAVGSYSGIILNPDVKTIAWNAKALVAGANGDMGENETAAFDPIFFLHHCNIDRMFWVWQKKHGKTEKLVIDETNAGVKITKENVTFGQKIGEILTLDTPLKPFKETSRMIIDINKRGYDYSIGSFDTQEAEPEVISYHVPLPNTETLVAVNNLIQSIPEKKTNSVYTVNVTGQGGSIYNVIGEKGESPSVWREDFVRVYGIDKEAFSGSFVVRAWYKPPEKSRVLIGQTAILDRWDASTCENCQNHRKTNVSFSLGHHIIAEQKDVTFDIVCHDMENGGKQVRTMSAEDHSDVVIDEVRFYSTFTKMRPEHTYNGIRVNFSRPVAWEEQRPVGCSDRCSLI